MQDEWELGHAFRIGYLDAIQNWRISEKRKAHPMLYWGAGLEGHIWKNS